MAYQAVPTGAVTLASLTGLTNKQIVFGGSTGLGTSSADLTYDDTTNDLVLSTSESGGTVGIAVANTSNTATSAAQIKATVAGASGGNATYQGIVSGVTTWTWGVDNANSDRWALNPSATLGTTDAVTVGTGGNLTVNGAPDTNYRIKAIDTSSSIILATASLTSGKGGTSTIAGGGTELDTNAYGSTAGGTIFGETKAGLCTLEAYPAAANGFMIGVSGAVHIGFTTNSLRRFTIDGAGSIICGAAALATNATDGFFYAPSCAGAPTGTPTTATGRAPMIIDTTNGRFYAFYGAAWHLVALV